MLKESLCGDGWTVREKGAASGYEAKAPCTVLSVLRENNKIDDIFYRENEEGAKACLEKDYEFIKRFNVSGEHMQQDSVELVFYGLDTSAEIFLNGSRLGAARNMHRTYRFDVKEKLHVGSNELCIAFESPLRFIREYTPGQGKDSDYTPTGSTTGAQYLRKAHCMYGWDWAPKLPDIGIFRDIRIESFSKIRLGEVFFSQDHYADEIVLHVDPVLEYTDAIPVELVVSVTGEEEIVNMTRMPEPGTEFSERGENEVAIQIHSPQLWWPNGMGEQPLYTVNVKLKKADKIYDEKEFRIGLRTISLSRKKDEYGEEFCFVINGRKMFAKGADYVPEDVIYPDLNERRTVERIKDAARANFNFLRVWGGGYYPDDYFYDACDRYGILVWQDLMFACNAYEMSQKFERTVLAEIHDNVSRIRHHACLALWCGNNEMEAAWVNDKQLAGASPALKVDYVKLFEYLLPRAVYAEDSVTPYWNSSPSSGGSFDDPEDENRGDSHYWDVWHGEAGFEEYRRHYFRFLSEFGFQSFPGIKTVRSFTGEVDRNIFSPVMESHQKSPSGNVKILRHISENFRYPRDFVQLLYVSQIMQGIAVKSCVEHMRQNRGRCMGTFFWQFNDCWPAVSWSSVDYYGRWKLLQYMARKFYAPIAGSVTVDGTVVQAFAANDTSEQVGVKVRTSLFAMDGREITHYVDETKVPADSSVGLKPKNFARQMEANGIRDVFICVDFDFSNGMKQSEVVPFVPYKHLNLKEAQVDIAVDELEDSYEITINSDVYTPFVTVDLRKGDAIFSDNAVPVFKNRPAVITVRKDDIKNVKLESADDFIDILEIYTLQGSFDMGDLDYE